MTKEEVKNMIYEAFKDVPYPQNITLLVASAHDSRDYDHNEEYRKQDFVGHWKDIPETYLYDYANILSYFEPDGIRYYIPRIMSWTLDNYEKGIEDLMQYLIYTMDPAFSEREKNIERNKYQFSLLNEEQNKACAHFLQYLKENMEESSWEMKYIESALASKRGKFL